MKKRLLMVGLSCLMGLAACGGSSSDGSTTSSDTGDDFDNHDTSDEISAGTKIDYTYTGSLMIAKIGEVNQSESGTNSFSTAAFMDSAGSTTLKSAAEFKDYCLVGTADDSDGDSNGGSDPISTDPGTTLHMLSAGTETIKQGDAVIATVTPEKVTLKDVSNFFYAPFPIDGDSDPFTAGLTYTFGFEGAANTNPAITISPFALSLPLSDPGTVSLDTTSLASIVTAGTPVSASDLQNKLHWQAMTGVKTMAQSAVDYGFQIVTVMDVVDNNKSVSCILNPGQTNLQAAIANTNTAVFDTLSGSTAVDLSLTQLHVVLAFPGRGSSSSNTGYVYASAVNMQNFTGIVTK